MSLSKQKTLAGQESRSITVTRAKVFTAISVLRLWQLKTDAHSGRFRRDRQRQGQRRNGCARAITAAKGKHTADR